jgi:TAP-like protein
MNVVPLTQATDAGNITLLGTQLKDFIFGQLYQPRQWTALAIQLDEVFAGNISSFTPQPLNLSVWNPAETISNLPIRCSDFGLRASNISDLVPLIEKQSAVSAFTKPLYYVSWQCATWRMRAKERYTGDFAVKTRNPIMLIGNTYDPVTPLRSAHNVSGAFEGSVVLQQDSYGHCSISQPSVCTAKAVRKYFLDGVLPEEGTVCESDVKPFETTRWSDVYLNGTLDTVVKRDVEDVRLLAALEALDDSMRKRWF